MYNYPGSTVQKCPFSPLRMYHSSQSHAQMLEQNKGKEGDTGRGDTSWEMPGLSNKMEQHEIICAITVGVSAFPSQKDISVSHPPETQRGKSVRRAKTFLSPILTMTESQTKQKHLFFSSASRKIQNKRD